MKIFVDPTTPFVAQIPPPNAALIIVSKAIFKQPNLSQDDSAELTPNGWPGLTTV
jgi:hypothetical protein